MDRSRLLRLTALALCEIGIGALLVAGCPPSSDCSVTLDCGPYAGVAGGAGGSGGTGGGGPAENGAPCTVPTDCASEMCVDEVCCDAACDGTCEACNVAGSEGTCAPEAAATDPAGDCPGGTCDGALGCAHGNPIWTVGFGSGANDAVNGVASDGAGAVIFGGAFGEAQFDDITFGGDILWSSGGSDVFIAKLDADDDHVWSFHYGDSENQFLNDLATDNAGAVIGVGRFQGQIDFGDGPLDANGTADDIFVVKLDPDGQELWSDRYGDSTIDMGHAVAVDGSDAVVMVGQFTGDVDFGSGLHGAAGTDIFVAKYDGDGTSQWSRHYGDLFVQAALGVGTDADDAVIFAGRVAGDVNFGGGVLPATSSDDAFVAKLDAGGTHVWSRRYGQRETQSFMDVAVGPDGSIVAVGFMQGEIEADAFMLECVGLNDALVVKLAPDGSVVWAQRFGDEDQSFAETVAIDGSGNVIVAGHFLGEIDFGGGPLTSAGMLDAFIAKLAPDGTHLWSYRFGEDTSPQISSSLAIDSGGALLWTGAFETGLDLGLGPLDYDAGLDLFVAKLSP